MADSETPPEWMAEYARTHIQGSIRTKEAVLDQCIPKISTAAQSLGESLANGGKLLCCGNGGSAADAQHIATEFMVRMRVHRPGIRAIALTTDTSLLTASANDYSFDVVFARQVETLGEPGDFLLAISTSGNSANVLRAVKTAKEHGIHTVGLTGQTGGELAAEADMVLRVPAEDTQYVQEAHIMMGHLLCGFVERQLHPDLFPGQ